MMMNHLSTKHMNENFDDVQSKQRHLVQCKICHVKYLAKPLKEILLTC